MKENNKSIVIIDPMVNVNYASFFIKGLVEKFGIHNIQFHSKPFEWINDIPNNRIMALNFIVVSGKKENKYTINFDDSYIIKEELYNWCDIYGNVNCNFEKTPKKFHSKLIALAPSFGIKTWNLPQTLFYGIHNWLKIRNQTNTRKFLGKYKKQFKERLSYSSYQQSNSDFVYNNKFIFHLSTLWYNDEWNKNDEGVNRVRANFIKACKSISEVTFEGGLATNRSNYNPVFEPVIFKGVISISDYLINIKKSILVFNTPAFWNCHGWKLGEYLSLGKAIISTPLSNDLPSPLIHGEHIHYVSDDIEEMKKAILLIVNDIEYRKKLESGARTYWEKYGTYTKSIELLGIY